MGGAKRPLRVLISYGDERFKSSLHRLGNEAKQLGVFDRVVLYTPKDLPEYIKSSPLMAYTRGGGYWAWKPYLIQQTLWDYPDGTIVVYVDAGCQLQQADEWQQWFSLMEEHEVLLFRYRKNFPYDKWEEIYGTIDSSIGRWTKQETKDYFNRMFGNAAWQQEQKIWGGANLWRGQDNRLLKQWLSITLMHPELVIDPIGKELTEQPDNYIQHRHDQSILTPLAYYYSQQMPIAIIDETAESEPLTAAIAAKRIRDKQQETSLQRFLRKLRRKLKEF